MNPSLSILEKLKNLFYQSVTNKTDFHVAFAPFAFTLTNEDFFFLKSDIDSGSDTRKYYKELSEFAHITNSILKKPHIWTIDSDNLLYNLYKNILQNAATIDPDTLTAEEQVNIAKAKAVLFKEDETDSDSYKKYRDYGLRFSELEKKIIEHNALKNTLATTNTAELDKWTIDLEALLNAKKELLIEWQVKGAKSAIEAAKKTYDTIIFNKVNFLEKWNDAKNIKLSESNALKDEYGVDFFSTTCVPNAICDYQAPIWKKITLSKQEIAELSQQYSQEVPNEVLAEFGNVEIQLDAIAFEYCIIDILRSSWFDESLLNNQYWKFTDDNTLLSAGDDSFRGEIPAYPVKIILSKNIELVYTPGIPKNEEINTKLKNGDRVFFGPLLLKTIPSNLPGNKSGSYRVQQLSTNQLSVITKVAIQNTASISKINVASKYKMVELMNKEPQQVMKKNVEIKSINKLNLQSRNSAVSPQNPAPVAAARLSTNPAMMTARVERIPIRETPIIRPEVVRPHGPIPAIPTERPTSPQPSTTPASALSTLNGKIVDEHNQPVELAEIQLMNANSACTQSFLSLSDGTYTLQNIETGKYNISVNKTGFARNEKIIEINGNANLDFLLIPQPVLTESFQVMAVICKKLPKLPDPVLGAHYI